MSTMDSEKISYWEQFLSELKEEEIPHLAIALDKLTNTINIADPINKYKEIWFNGEVNPHVIRVNVKEGWIEQYVPIKISSEDSGLYDVKNGYPIIERHYGEVEIK